MIEGDGDVDIVDLRHAMSIELEPHRIPGARVMTLEEIEARHEEIPRDRDIVLYCT